MAFDIYLFGTNTPNTQGTFPTDYTKYSVLSLDYTFDFKKAGERGEHGGLRSPIGKIRTMTLSFFPVANEDYFNWVENLFDLLTKRYIYLNSGDYYEDFGTIRIVPTGSNTEHTHDYANKSIDIEVGIYDI